MIEVTPRALLEAQSVLQRLGAKQAAIRILVKEKGCNCSRYRMAIDDEVREGDRVLEIEGVRFLFDPKSAAALEGGVLDFVDEGHRRGFVIHGGAEAEHHHHHDGGCGCGHH